MGSSNKPIGNDGILACVCTDLILAGPDCVLCPLPSWRLVHFPELLWSLLPSLLRKSQETGSERNVTSVLNYTLISFQNKYATNVLADCLVISPP